MRSSLLPYKDIELGWRPSGQDLDHESRPEGQGLDSMVEVTFESFPKNFKVLSFTISVILIASALGELLFSKSCLLILVFRQSGHA